MGDLITRQQAIDAVDARIEELLHDRAFQKKAVSAGNDLYGVKEYIRGITPAEAIERPYWMSKKHEKMCISKEEALNIYIRPMLEAVGDPIQSAMAKGWNQAVQEYRKQIAGCETLAVSFDELKLMIEGKEARKDE